MIEKKGGAEGKAGYYYLIKSAFFYWGFSTDNLRCKSIFLSCKSF